MPRTQASVVMLPSAISLEFKSFCELNKGLFPLLHHSLRGDTNVGNLARESDIRTALSRYLVLKDGQIVSSIADLEHHPWDDMVAFYIGSINHCIERELRDAEIPIQSSETSHSTPLYKTNIQCKESGPFSSPVFVCMHPIPKQFLQRAITTTAQLEATYGLAIHIGDPAAIGIKDINVPDHGESPKMDDKDHKVPVFWASSATAHFAVRSAGLPLAFTDDMENLLLCESTIEEFIPQSRTFYAGTKPRVVIMKEVPFTVSVLSENAAMKISSLETEIQEDIGERGITKLHIPGELLRAALVLSHSTSVAVHFGFPCVTDTKFPDETDGPPGALAICKALSALGKKVTFIASSYQAELVWDLVGKFLQNEVNVLEFSPGRTRAPDGVRIAAEEFLFHDGTNQMRPKFDALVAIEATARTDDGCYVTMKGRNLLDVLKDSPVDELFIQAHKSGKIATIGIGDGGNEIGMGKVHQRVIDHINNGPQIASSVSTDQLITAGVSNWGGSALAAALFVVHQCPFHSRYVRRGIEQGAAVSFEEALNTVVKEEEVLLYLNEIGVCDGISKWKKMSVDDHPFDPVHKNKLQRLLVIAASSSYSKQ